MRLGLIIISLVLIFWAKAEEVPDSLISTDSTATLHFEDIEWFQSQVDSSQVDLRKFDEIQMYEYQSSKEFLYDRKPISTSFFDKFVYWLKNLLKSIFGSTREAQYEGAYWLAQFLKILLYVVGALAIIAVIKQFYGIEINTIMGGTSNRLKFEEFSEDVREIDFKERITQAMKEENYRLAFRYLYLDLLKNLTARDLISWQQEKTNYDYWREIDAEYKQGFGDITYQYEKAWYGDYEIDKDAFYKLEAELLSFQKSWK